MILPQRCAARFATRRELACFTPRIHWAHDAPDALDQADGVVIALRPADQCEWAAKCLARSRISRLILEKPLAPMPEAAGALHRDLVRSGKAFRIGYTFRCMPWAVDLHAFCRTQPPAELVIRWEFLAHHFQHGLKNWKRLGAEGGGVIRFYGTQLIALLAEFGYRIVDHSTAAGSAPDEPERWSAVFTGAGLPRCRVAIDSKAPVNRFSIVVADDTGKRTTIIEQDDPFANAPSFSVSGQDRRVEILAQIIRSLSNAQDEPYPWYSAAIELWEQVERVTRYEFTSPPARRILVSCFAKGLHRSFL